jgi:serine protein kinase
MESLIRAVKATDLGEDEKKRLLEFLQVAIKNEYNRILEKEVTSAFIHGYREQAESLFNNYLDHAEAFATKVKLKDANTGEELEPDEKFMESIESQIGLTGSAAKGFRQDVTSYMFSLLRNNVKLDYTSYEPLKEAIEKKLTASVRELSRIITKARVRDSEQNRKYDSMVEEMKRNGYCDHCCNVILRYAANNLWKD